MSAAAVGRAFDARFAGRLRRSEPMSRHTSWHVGGPADWYFEPRDRADLAEFLHELPHELPLWWVGLGSNLLVRDGGLRGAVIVLHGTFERLERLADGDVHCDAGVPCARLARQCLRWGIGPADFFAGIPGTFGGALAMNAGAFGGETWPHVAEVEVIGRDGTIRNRAAGEYRIAYRQCLPPVAHEGFLAARLRFGPRSEADDAPIRAMLERRRATQPIGAWSCGSVFTNPPGDHAARLIEAAGLKGRTVGGARVSPKHANFIINEGTATAADLETLITQVQQTVEAKFGIRLVPEVRIVGEAA
ncbi:MAG: UDP-N-acetylmuramate dehydrogenase [Sinobacteraceae bacterium]|nr:UDP-N-acetylmuramate dehydrogenase [Nevskiaceae bacterium]MCP5360854.1 UDP-N-acetylmuramate dehydrogenase [Nevskiaceae bacterium]MCP5466315.1 UDP-N-acetylmuramate dehydrogenase [Nevskiaceae bacterium]